MKNPFLSRTVTLLAVSAGVAACGSAPGTSSPVAGAVADRPAAVTPSAAPPSTPASVATTAPAATPRPVATDTPAGARTTAPVPVPAKTDDGFSRALTAWKAAAAANAAMMNSYLQQAAADLKAAGNSSYNTAISELTYLASLPATNNTSAQVAQAQSDEKDLDKFFGTPGLMD